MRRELEAASHVVPSRLAIAACGRALVRGRTTSRLDARAADEPLRLLAAAVPSWSLVEVTTEILREVGRPFPHGPLLTLDAVHLATASFLRSALPDLRMLCLEDRVRVNAGLLGFPVRPAPRRHP